MCLFNTAHKAAWALFAILCESLPGRCKYYLGNTSIAILVLAVIYCPAFESMAFQATNVVCNCICMVFVIQKNKVSSSILGGF